ncbi:Peroxidasin [Nymphon striatum]|nr:Peroxidasin [Nymphon striatum]
MARTFTDLTTPKRMNFDQKPTQLDVSDGDLLPKSTETCGNVTCFVAGDDRANEQVDLALMHTIFMREHNKIVDQIRNLNYDWDNDRIFYEASLKLIPESFKEYTKNCIWGPIRQRTDNFYYIVAAQLQVIVYKEYLPAILGEDFVLNNKALNINRKTHYRPWINPGIFNEFATAAFRFGHSMIRDNLPWPGHKGIELSSIFFKPYHLHFGEHVIGEVKYFNRY